MTVWKWVVSIHREVTDLPDHVQSYIDRADNFHLIMINEAADLYEAAQAGNAQRQRYVSPAAGAHDNCIVLYGVSDDSRQKVMEEARRVAEYALLSEA